VKISEQISTEELERLNSLDEEVIHADKTYTYGKQTQNGTTDETVVTSESIENISSTEPIIK